MLTVIGAQLKAIFCPTLHPYDVESIFQGKKIPCPRKRDIKRIIMTDGIIN
ncbi:MAG: hypothetical protein O8C64_03100 [Candidatus Methanoperedens sp.]|nr:hypothetical protein [Candidatus Methanoperedens sp.]